MKRLHYLVGCAMFAFCCSVSTAQQLSSKEGIPKQPMSIGKQFISVEKYRGRYEDLALVGYTTTSSIGRVNADTMAQSICRPFRGKFDCVFVLSRIEGRSNTGQPIHSAGAMIRLDIPKRYKYFDSADANCKSTLYPTDDILVIGQWTWRKKPLVGGYVSVIQRAWRLDYDRLEFFEIESASASCVIYEDRN